MCYDAQDCDRSLVSRVSNPVARKLYACGECGGPIPKGTKHRYVFDVSDDGPSTFRVHAECDELRDFIEDVICGGEGFIPLGCLLDEIHEASDYYAPLNAPVSFRDALMGVVDEIRAHYTAQAAEVR